MKSGTATRAAVPGVTIAGKTGTTEGYGDAWFVGWTKEYTVAVWVGYPDQFKPMETEFQGDPVAGGTYPAGHLQDVHRVAGRPEAGQEGLARRGDDPRRAARLAAAGLRGAAEHRRRRRGRRRADAVGPGRLDARGAGARARAAGAARARADRGARDAGARDAAGARARDGRHGRRAGAQTASTSRGPRDAARARHAEPPRQVGGLGDPDPRAAARRRRPRSPARRSRSGSGPVDRGPWR